MKSILKTACSAGVGLLIVGGSILGAQGAMAADEPDSPSTTSSGGVSSVRSTEDLDGQVSTRGYLGRATQTAATGVTPGSEIKEGAIVQLVNDEQIDGVYKVILPVPEHTTFVSATSGGQLIGSNVVWTFNVAHDGGTRAVTPMATFTVDADYWGPQITNNATVLYTGGVFTDDHRFTYNYSHSFAERAAVPVADPTVGLAGAGVIAVGAAGAFALRRRSSATR
ncbi:MULTISPECIES: hypothetical protein [unclassified Microbacterium]|uniref:hypothetical protein n=1 Tax=unclassified Microbacterium TaxID=2609290 RepID=UPI0008F45BDA|nr:hypothetical protein [Microbacterium sp. LCT-H2]OIJ34623.1 hypothetical protein BK819_03870 [Microbacterium sp. LCT-H2]